MIFQQNYFGTFTHFSTLGEYLQKRAEGQIGDPIDLTYRPGMVRHDPFCTLALWLIITFFLTVESDAGRSTTERPPFSDSFTCWSSWL